MSTGKIILALMFLLTGTASADAVDEGIASVKQTEGVDFGAEARVFADGATPEFMLAYKNFSADWIHDDKDFLKLKVDKKIFALMGTGLEWNVALNAVGEDRAFLPSVGFNLYMRIRPRLDLYAQFSGFTLGRRAHVTDFESGIKYFPRKNFSIRAGWRSIDFKLRRGGSSSDFNLHGLFAGVRYDF